MFRQPFESGSLFVNGQRLTVFWHELDLAWCAVGPHGVLVQSAEPKEALSRLLPFVLPSRHTPKVAA